MWLITKKRETCTAARLALVRRSAIPLAQDVLAEDGLFFAGERSIKKHHSSSTCGEGGLLRVWRRNRR
jgi:hypothetical protein